MVPENVTLDNYYVAEAATVTNTRCGERWDGLMIEEIFQCGRRRRRRTIRASKVYIWDLCFMAFWKIRRRPRVGKMILINLPLRKKTVRVGCQIALIKTYASSWKDSYIVSKVCNIFCTVIKSLAKGKLLEMSCEMRSAARGPFSSSEFLFSILPPVYDLFLFSLFFGFYMDIYIFFPPYTTMDESRALPTPLPSVNGLLACVGEDFLAAECL